MDLDLLRKTALFADLDDTELARVAEVCEECAYPAGQVIFREGEPGTRLFLIVAGSVRISRAIPGGGEESFALLTAGTCFGEMAVLDRSERSTDAVAAEACTLATISRADFELLLDRHRDLGYKILWSVVRLLCARLRATNDSLRSVLTLAGF